MATPTKQDVVTEGLDLLIDFWKDKPKARGLLETPLRELQQVEDTIFQLLEDRGILVAVGEQLNNYGRLYSVPRAGMEDMEYRLAILRRIAINNSDGTEPVILDILASITGCPSPQLFEHYPAFFMGYVDRRATRNLAVTLDEIAAAGVGTLLMFDDEGDSFVGSEIIPSQDLIFTNNNEAIELDDGSLLATPSYVEVWSSNHSFLPEEGEDTLNPMAEVFDTSQFIVEAGILTTNNNEAIELDDGSILAWKLTTGL